MTSNDDADVETMIRKTLASLDVQRKAMEFEADAILSELTTPPSEGAEPMGMDTPLVDREGYPRADIDVYRAREQRNRFRVLKTDHKEIEGKIEGLLLQLMSLKNPSKKKEESEEKARRLAPKPLPKYDAVTGKWVVKNWDGSVSGVTGGDGMSFENLSQNRNNASRVSSTGTEADGRSVGNGSNATVNNDTHLSSGSSSGTSSDSSNRQPFAKVDWIATESPAEYAGMKVGDLVTRFGPLDAKNNDQLRAVAKLVPEVAGDFGRIQLVVLRFRGDDNDRNNNTDYGDDAKWEKTILFLQPRPFSGRGLLGCRIIPFD